jgi:hypothetical protein
MEDKLIIFTKLVNFNAPCSVNKTQLKFLFKETVGCSCITRLVCFTDVMNARMKRNFLEGEREKKRKTVLSAITSSARAFHYNVLHRLLYTLE